MPNLTDVQRRCIVDELLKRSICGDLPHGAKAAVARDFERSRSTVSKIWARYRLSIEAGVTEGEWRSRIRDSSGRKKKSRAQAVELLQAVPVEDRSVERRAASLAGVSRHLIRALVAEDELARLRYDSHRKCQWDGKLGLWPLTEEDVYKDYLLRCVIPAIKEQWPRGQRRHPIMIQQDNAKPHVSPLDPDIVAAGMEGEWCIRLLFQPPNSPDLNVLDLGLFNAIQSIQNRVPIHGIDNLITAVQNAYTNMDTDALDNIFLTLQGCMLCILQESGGNRYALPHIGKEALRRKSILPRVLKCDHHLYDSAKACLVEAGRPSLIFFDPAE
ncbi:hypothetical protein KRP22_009136 [Phytophthora ramorum]|nr:hypothetical protein KRP22_7966 [Phytophthora ramorum]